MKVLIYASSLILCSLSLIAKGDLDIENPCSKNGAYTIQSLNLRALATIPDTPPGLDPLKFKAFVGSGLVLAESMDQYCKALVDLSINIPE